MKLQYIEYYEINKSIFDDNLIMDLQKIIMSGSKIGIIACKEKTYVAIIDKHLDPILKKLDFKKIERPDYNHIYIHHTYFSPGNNLEILYFYPDLDIEQLKKNRL